ncbi:hypothetical protein SAMD00019534_086080 [Acytostelium subglobosum LB1]|uniref:hypothetical protein n=1 Tax=Acytostelium subglobosum LB1 TaxID=1410327 RepID=UPI0006450F39|nr:hypothetical protein SAMD00019534_086080 [Acytostelium subglobosum LB1]GAM25433.1 hypothetical protein SAMD00019534_086080 [Acytostelium subglobosum LB1]|eukprot:XP_012751419.1 hypothetical protein SAMD00019534_086080 [Acytostelium subglobosum LB1]
MDDHESLKAQGNESFKQQNYDEAIQYYTKAIEASEGKIAMYYGNRAASYMAIGTKKSLLQSIEDSEKAIEIDRNFIKGYTRASKCLVQLGRFDQAQSVIVNGLVIDPRNSELLSEKINVESIKRQLQSAQDNITTNTQQALNQIESVLTLAKFYQPAIVIKAKLLLEVKQYSKASNLMTSLLQEDQTNSEYLYLRGLAMYYSNSFPSAIQHFQNSLAYDPDFSQSRIALKRVRSLEAKKKEGNDAFTAKNYTLAYQLFTEALEIDPKFDTYNSQLYNNRAAAALQLNKITEAIDDCTKAIELDPNYVKALTRRAQCYLKKEQFEDAVRDYEKAKTLDPENEDIHANLKHAKVELKKSLRKDYYKILGVAKDATDSDIKKAYRKLALQYHPDKNSTLSDEEKATAEKMFKDVGEAYGVLSDPKKKQRFDMGQDENGFPLDSDDFSGFGGGGGINIFDLFQRSGMGGMGGGMGGGGFGGGFGGMGGGGFGGGSPFGGGHFHQGHDDPFGGMGGGGFGGFDFGGGGHGHSHGAGGHSHGGQRQQQSKQKKGGFRYG